MNGTAGADYSAANMIQDVVSEINELLEESSGASDDYRAGVFHAAGILFHKLNSFEIDQSKWNRPMIDPERWYLGGSNA
jgi:hypothetical protein